MNYFKDCKTLDEAKKLYYELAKKLHPDMGGDTRKFQDLNQEFHSFLPKEENYKYKNEVNDWNSEAYACIIESLLKIPGIVIEIVGSWVWLSGDTKPVKDQIKAVNCGEKYVCRWHKTKLMWYFSPKGYRKSSKKDLTFDQIKNFYGSDQIKTQEESSNNYPIIYK